MPPRTVFVTGGSGFIGRAFVREAVAAGYRVSALARSEASAARLTALGATGVIGDARDDRGTWRSAAAAAELVVHLAQPEAFGGRVTDARARRYRDERLDMDEALLGALDPALVDRIVYVAGTSYYGDLARETLHDESAEPHPRGWGPYIAPALEALAAQRFRGLPIVEAFPGWVYGPGSWFGEYVLAPLRAGKPLVGLSGRPRLASLVHVDDCARALLHLLEAGENGARYFVVDDAPVETDRLGELAARVMGVPFKTRKLPRIACRLLLGRVITESLTYENRLSNKRLRDTGFVPQFPTYERGVPDVVERWLRTVPAPEPGERAGPPENMPTATA
jgi:nucleoside-diphosphate-sugar epimerase